MLPRLIRLKLATTKPGWSREAVRSAIARGSPRSCGPLSYAQQACHELPELSTVRGISQNRPSIRSFRTSVTQYATNSTNAPVRDEMIPYSRVQFVQPDNSLSAVRPLSDILRSYSKSTHSLILVSQDPPIVKLVAKADVQKSEKQRKEKEKARRMKGMEEAEVQVTWESATGDLEHKLHVAKHILEEKGDRIQLEFSSKRPARNPPSAGFNPDGTPKPPPPPKLSAKQEHIISYFVNPLTDPATGSATEWKPRELTHKHCIVYLEPTASVRAERVKRLEDQSESKSKEKEAKKAERRAKEEERKRKAEERARAEMDGV